MCFNAIRENKILAKISEFTLFRQYKYIPFVQEKYLWLHISPQTTGYFQTEGKRYQAAE